MDKKLGWLHLSDLHFLDKHGWQNNHVLEKLLKDVTALHEEGLQIDLVFCTGDIGFGETSPEPLAEQYANAKEYFDKVLEICQLPPDRFFLVPGNHDIDRKQVLASQTEYFRSANRKLEEINQMFHDRHLEIQKAMGRLDQYRQFVSNNYSHIALDHNGNFGTWLAINDVQVSIAGLNSAWTCADNEDKGQLWLAGEAQLNACKTAIESPSGINTADLRIALIHHSLDWLNPNEARELRGRMENDFDFLLHGHAHDQWVNENTRPYHIVIAAGAATASTAAEFGYNLVQIKSDTAQARLRCWDAKGSGWVNEEIAGRAKNGIWPIQPPPSFAASGPLSEASEYPNQSPSALGIRPPLGGAVVRGHFGLDGILARCSEKLKQSPLLALFGLAGVGKTVIAEELRLLPEWHNLRHIPYTVHESSGLADLFSVLASHLDLHDERPRPPIGKTPREIAKSLRNMASQVAPFYMHIQRGQLWFSGGKWRTEVKEISDLLEGLVLAYPGSAIILETREKPESLTSFEASGLPKEVLNEYFAQPPGVDGVSWELNGDQRKSIFQRLGGGHGRGVHAYGLFLLTQLAAAKKKRPDEILKSYANDFADVLYAKLFRDLYENVLSKTERNLLFACSLYRNGLHYSHLSRLDAIPICSGTSTALIRRRLLTEDGDWFYLHDLAAEQARMLAQSEAQTRSLHSHIAGFWLDDLQGQRAMIEANIRRALEALYHLEQSGGGERIAEIAPELFGRRPDEAATMLWRLEEQLNKRGQDNGVRVTLEYLITINPEDHRAMRFLGERRRKLYGPKDQQAFLLFRSAKNLDPDFPIYWSNYGHAAIDCGADAITQFLAEIGNAPHRVIKDDYFAAIRATALQAAGRGDEASRLRQEKIDGGSHNAVFYCDEAKYLLDEKHDPDGALAVLDKAHKNSCANDFTEAIRATALHAAGRGDEASRLRQEKIDGGSHNAAFYCDEAKYLLDEKHDPDGALAVLDKARKNGCADDFTEVIRAMTLQAAGRGDEASLLRQEKIDGGSHNAVFYCDEAKYLLDEKHDPDGALAVLDKARKNGCADDFTEVIRATTLQAAGRSE